MSSKKLPSFSQWKQLFKTLKGAERKFFLAFVVLVLFSGIVLVAMIYMNVTKEVPAFKGSYTEGVVGQPRFINPIYGETNDVDRTLIDLIYSGIMTYDKDGNIVGDLAESYQILDGGKTYMFQLKDDLFWQDGHPLTVDDIIYTIKIIQNSDYKSPLRASWLDIEVEKISDKTFAFYLASPYNPFLEISTVKIIPQHIWEKVLPENFALSTYNLQPVGSGRYVLSNLEQNSTGFIKRLKLIANKQYYDKIPYISNVYFEFFSKKEDLIKAINKKSIDGFSISSLNNNQALAEEEIHQRWILNKKFNVYSFYLPRYFAVFFNQQKSSLLSDSKITKAINYSVNKQELAENINDAFGQKVSIINSPLIPEYFGYSKSTATYEFDIKKANDLLDDAGYTYINEIQRAKPNSKKLAFQFKNYLSSKSSGSEVRELQECLVKLDDNFKNILGDETNGKYGRKTGDAVTAFQKKYLPDVSSTAEVGVGTRKKLNELCFVSQDRMSPLTFTLTTINQPQMVQVAEFLKEYWQNVGITIDINALELSELKGVMKNRDYDALLYGQALGLLPDLYPFWHSTQVNHPGLNLTSLQNKTVDQLLKDGRETQDQEIKAIKYEELQNIIIESTSALFLYNPDYLYWVSDEVKGIDTTKIVDPAKRFSNIENWFVKTKRALK